jgi:hypothetical protein
MKIVFLDVDGCLNMHTSGGMYALNRKRLQLLEKLIKETGAHIVLSSTWRKDVKALKKLSRNFRYRGLKIYDVTPDFSFQENGERAYRGHEIQKWLNDHPEVEQYVIIDDDNGMLDSQLRNFIQTDGNVGLTETICYRAKYILENGFKNII